jgi:hypothetical protein
MNIGFYGDRYKQERGKEESIDEWRTRLEKRMRTVILICQ